MAKQKTTGRVVAIKTIKSERREEGLNFTGETSYWCRFLSCGVNTDLTLLLLVSRSRNQATSGAQA